MYAKPERYKCQFATQAYFHFLICRFKLDLHFLFATEAYFHFLIYRFKLLEVQTFCAARAPALSSNATQTHSFFGYSLTGELCSWICSLCRRIVAPKAHFHCGCSSPELYFHFSWHSRPDKKLAPLRHAPKGWRSLGPRFRTGLLDSYGPNKTI